ncbi:DUF6323 family protein [Ruminococcaceae bacterium OttesenSCG-928-D13]|nr:DUF6323 family protein [Ruminococcaceae bacterium OttesenSCG-928-D13]
MKSESELILPPQNLAREVAALTACNTLLARHGHHLTPADAAMLAEARGRSLAAHGRVEFGEGILPRLLYAFCDAPALRGDALAEAVPELLDIFYYLKNETAERLTDDELLDWMADSFNTTCHGSLELLAVRAAEGLIRSVLGLDGDDYPEPDEEEEPYDE